MIGYFITITVLVSFTRASKLPSFITPCSRHLSDVDLSRCVFDEAQKIQKEICRGVPELGVVSMDPMLVGDFNVSAVAVTVVQKNVLVKGSCKVDIKEIILNRKIGYGKIVLYGNFTATSDYDINGRLLIFPIIGSGKFKVKMEHTEVSMEFKMMSKTLNDNKIHYVLYDVKPSHSIGNAKIKMDGLFRNDSGLGHTVNQAVNENWRELMKDFGPPSVNAVVKTTTDIINSFFAAVPSDDLFI